PSHSASSSPWSDNRTHKRPSWIPKFRWKYFPPAFDSHPPVIVGHLFQMNGSARGHDFIESGTSIRQLALRPDFHGTAVLFPFHVVIIIKWIRPSQTFGWTAVRPGPAIS